MNSDEKLLVCAIKAILEGVPTKSLTQEEWLRVAGKCASFDEANLAGRMITVACALEFNRVYDESMHLIDPSNYSESRQNIINLASASASALQRNARDSMVLPEIRESGTGESQSFEFIRAFRL